MPAGLLQILVVGGLPMQDAISAALVMLLRGYDRIRPHITLGYQPMGSPVLHKHRLLHS